MAEVCEPSNTLYIHVHPSWCQTTFYGGEFGATSEWNHKSELQWELLQFEPHRKLKDCIRDLNKLLTSEPALYENQFNIHGFEWVDLNHRAESVMVYRRKGKLPENDVLVVLNLTPVVRKDWKVYAKGKSEWKELFNSDALAYGGAGQVFNPEIAVIPSREHEEWFELNVHLPALAALVLK